METNNITVVGSGTMGRGIVHVAALAGYKVIMNDLSQELLEKAYKQVATNMEEGVKRGKYTEEEVKAALTRITLCADLKEAVANADFVIEAVPEIMELKVETFNKLISFTRDDAILASNTSSMSITELAGSTSSPERIVGMHFFNPVFKMKLVEIVKGLETSERAVAATKHVAVTMGKETIVVHDAPGFATSRISALIGNEAMYMLQEGVATAHDIDKALKLALNFPMGPLELGDLIGWDTRLKILEYLHRFLGEKFRPCPLIYQYVHAGRLGRKTGKGIYDYN